MGDTGESQKLLPPEKKLEAKPEIISEGEISKSCERASCHRPYLVELVFFLLGAAWAAFVQLSQEYVFMRFYENVSACGSSSEDTCSNLTDFSKITEAAEDTALMSGKINLVRGIPQCVMSLLIVSFTDQVGRKFGLAVPAIGGIIRSLTYLFVVYSNASLSWLYIGEFLDGLSGEHLTAIGCGFAYISDICDEDKCSFRYTICASSFFMASCLMNLVISVIIDKLGFLAACWTVFAIYTVTLLYCTLVLHETVEKKSKEDGNTSTLRGVREAMTGFILFFRNRENKYIRTSLILILLASFFVAVNLMQADYVIAVYAQGPPFGMAPLQVGTVLAIFAAIAVVLPPIGSKLFRFCVSDVVMGAIATAINAGLCVIIGVVNHPLELYIFGGLFGYSFALPPLYQSLMARLAEPHERGAVQACACCMNSIGSVVGYVFLMTTYAYTVAVYHGIVFFIMALLFFVCSGFLVIIWIYQTRNKRLSMDEELASNRSAVSSAEDLLPLDKQ